MLIELLTESLVPFDPASVKDKTEVEQRLAANSHQVEQPQIARNCLRAISDLWPQISEDQKTLILPLVQQIADEFFAPDVRIQASELLKSITAPKPK
jgi:hypothetical protein